MSEEPIRIVGKEPPSPPSRPSTGRLFLAGAAVAGAVAGFLIGGIVASPTAGEVAEIPPATAETT